MSEPHATSRASATHFDAVASTWEADPGHTALARAVANAILEVIPLVGTERAMEFGCGTGLVTGLLARSVGHLLATDNSTGMLDVLRRKLRELDIHNVEPMQADLAQQLPAGPFDFVFSSMTLHHIEDVADLLARVHDALAPGGRVAFADLAKEDGSFHGPDIPGVLHHGFEPAELTRWLEAAGFADVRVRIAHRMNRSRADGSTREYPVLLVTARRPGEP
ncbi:MAG: methyltransferase domain-containing protein [Burkholderiaceae bacterium]|nr:methyltransferase domain-containing protein [Burkholderiaceae bacterium]MEB2352327.1 methyltransferase domain-containing protein [Burkholderiaceae bacterium]